VRAALAFAAELGHAGRSWDDPSFGNTTMLLRAFILKHDLSLHGFRRSCMVPPADPQKFPKKI